MNLRHNQAERPVADLLRDKRKHAIIGDQITDIIEQMKHPGIC
jgi:hypothetical protein